MAGRVILPCMTATTPLKFRVRISPDWQALHPAIKERASRLGFTWPSTSHPARFPRVYTVTLAGQIQGDSLITLDVSCLEPPKETVVHSALKTWDGLDVSFKVAGKKAYADANPNLAYAPDVLAVHIDPQGLFFPAINAGPTPQQEQRLVSIPLAKLVRSFADLLLGRAQIKRTGVDHIVERYSSLPDLDGFQVSRWRGDNFYRLAAPWVRIEVSVDPATRA